MASGDTLCVFNALNGIPPTSNYATFDFRNWHPVLDFDGATNESIVFSGVMPQHYGGSGVDVQIHYAVDGASGDIDWDAAFELVGDQDQDIDSDGFAAVQSTDGTTVPGTAGNVDVVVVAFTDGAQMDSVLAGDAFRLKITRDAASDTNTDDANVLWVVIEET